MRSGVKLLAGHETGGVVSTLSCKPISRRSPPPTPGWDGGHLTPEKGHQGVVDQLEEINPASGPRRGDDVSAFTGRCIGTVLSSPRYADPSVTCSWACPWVSSAGTERGFTTPVRIGSIRWYDRSKMKGPWGMPWPIFLTASQKAAWEVGATSLLVLALGYRQVDETKAAPVRARAMFP